MGEELNLGKAFICVRSDIGTEKEKWHEAELKSIDSLSVRKETEATDPVPWQTSFSFTTTVEPTRSLHKLIGVYRKNRGSSRSFRQKMYRTRHYLVRSKQRPTMQTKHTWYGVRMKNVFNRLWNKP